MSEDRSSLLTYKARNKNRIMDLITTDVESIADELHVKAVLRAHRNHFLTHRISVFEREVTQITQRLGPDSIFIDLGCWTGVLSRLVLNTVTPAAYMGIDAGLWYVQIAREILPPWCKFRSFYLLPDAAADVNRVDKLYFTLEDPLNTSGFYTRRTVSQDKLAAMPVGKTIRPIDFAHYLKANFDMAKLYLKMDIEGVDQELVQALIKTDTLPQVIHFEMLEKFLATWPETRKAIANSYDFIDLPGSTNTTGIIVAIRKGETFAPATILWNKSTKEITTLA